MDEFVKYLLLKTVQDNNILPITSVCNLACQFCSHQQNPRGIQVYRFGHLNLDLIKELIDFLPVEGPVIIGESATRIIEGEPFTHPEFYKILYLIRKKWPEKEIKITSNGTYLTEGTIKFLKGIGKVELNLSLNCSTPDERLFLMRDNRSAIVFRGLELLSQNNICYNGSIVAMPHLIGWESLERTVELLINNDSRTIRVFLPGYTKYTKDGLKFNSKDMLDSLNRFIERMNKRYETPVLLEPPVLKDFKCVIKGIIKGSSSAYSGLRRGDIILNVDNVTPISRVEAFYLILNALNPEIEVLRENKILSYKLKKKKGEKPGIILDYDLRRDIIDRLKKILIENRDNRVLIISSILAYDLIKELIKKISLEIESSMMELLAVNNTFFGGSIMSAGLLVNADIIRAVRMKGLNKYNLLVLPGIIYDSFGNDLNGNTYKKLNKIIKTEVNII
jgi:MoaA/NifB/PqqE/SkfB family radical SAM enzyme